MSAGYRAVRRRFMLIRERFAQLTKEVRERWQTAPAQTRLNPARRIALGACALLLLLLLPFTCTTGEQRKIADNRAARIEERARPQTGA